MPEKQVENRFRLAVKAKGGLCLKLICPGFTGVPDRLVLMPGGRLFFAEFKYGKGRTTPRQDAVIARLKGLGFNVYLINEKNIDEHIIML